MIRITIFIESEGQPGIPSLGEIDEIKNSLIMSDVKNSIKVDNLDKYIQIIKENASADASSTEIAAALLKRIREN